MLPPWTHRWSLATFLWVWRTCAECLHDPGQETEGESPGRGLLCSLCHTHTTPHTHLFHYLPLPLLPLPPPPALRKLWDHSDLRTGTQAYTLNPWEPYTQTGQRFRRERPWEARFHTGPRRLPERGQVPGQLLPERDSVGCSGGGRGKNMGPQ